MKEFIEKRVNLFLAAALMMLLSTPLMGQLQTTKLKGNIVQNGEKLEFATIKIFQDKQLLMGANTNSKGFYEILNMTPGTYDLEVWYVGKQIAEMSEVVVFSGKYKTVNFTLSEMKTEVIRDFKDNPMMDIDNVVSGAYVDHSLLTKLPVRSVEEVVKALAGVTSVRENDPLKIRGARAGATAYYIDGVKVIGPPSLPNPMIEQLQVITGGIPAEFGDVTGGVILVTTRNLGMRPPRVQNFGRRARKPRRKNKKEKKSLKQSNLDFDLDLGFDLEFYAVL